MEHKIIYSNDYIRITRQADDLYIESFKTGFTLDEFSRILEIHPEIKLVSFIAAKNSIVNAPVKPTKFAEIKERVKIDISNDGLKAYVTLCVPDNDLKFSKLDVIKEVLKKLSDTGIVFGLKQDVLLNSLTNGTPILIAEGLIPINGEDSKITMYQLKEPKPEAKEDENVNYYDLCLINKVLKGEWLGERIDATKGIPGKSVKGSIIQAIPGKQHPILYDKNSVKEVSEGTKTVLYSTRSGAVNYDGDKIFVSNHVEIPNNVDFTTGNIDFDGYVTVKGSVEDNFSVYAQNDIEILGDYGAGGINEIESKGGSIFIKGGIAGKNKAIIRSRKNIYTKFVSDSCIICEGIVHIGFYCLNSTIIAKQVILDSPKGQIIGGNIKAEISVIASIIGSTREIRTNIYVKGFNRASVKDSLESLVISIAEYKKKLIKVGYEMSLRSVSDNDNNQNKDLDIIKENFYEIKKKIHELEEEKRLISTYLKTRGEGEVTIIKKAYPNTKIEINGAAIDINKPITGTTYYYLNDTINEC